MFRMKVARPPIPKRRKTTDNSEENSQPLWSLKALLKMKSLGNGPARDIPASKREAEVRSVLRGKVARTGGNGKPSN